MTIWQKLVWLFRRKKTVTTPWLKNEAVGYQMVYEWKDANGNTHRVPTKESFRVSKP